MKIVSYTNKIILFSIFAISNLQGMHKIELGSSPAKSSTTSPATNYATLQVTAQSGQSTSVSDVVNKKSHNEYSFAAASHFYDSY